MRRARFDDDVARCVLARCRHRCSPRSKSTFITARNVSCRDAQVLMECTSVTIALLLIIRRNAGLAQAARSPLLQLGQAATIDAVASDVWALATGIIRLLGTVGDR